MGICASTGDAQVVDKNSGDNKSQQNLITVSPKREPTTPQKDANGQNTANASPVTVPSQSNTNHQHQQSTSTTTNDKNSLALPTTQVNGTSPRGSNVKAEDIEVKIVESGNSDVGMYLKNVPILGLSPPPSSPSCFSHPSFCQPLLHSKIKQ
jgi:hypothetical protein